jgi:hypothetical protein
MLTPEMLRSLSKTPVPVPALRALLTAECCVAVRRGAQPAIDENFYKATYPDVAMAISRGDIRSALDHYIKAGASERRAANPMEMQARRAWVETLGR